MLSQTFLLSIMLRMWTTNGIRIQCKHDHAAKVANRDWLSDCTATLVRSPKSRNIAGAVAFWAGNRCRTPPPPLRPPRRFFFSYIYKQSLPQRRVAWRRFLASKSDGHPRSTFCIYNNNAKVRGLTLCLSRSTPTLTVLHSLSDSQPHPLQNRMK